MEMKAPRRIAAIAVLLFLLAAPSDLSSCGPFIPSAVFTRLNLPENERDFFGGHLGLLQPTYYRRYLAMAYRILNDAPLRDDVIAALDSERRRRMTVGGGQAANDDPVKIWKAARLQVPEIKPVEIRPYRIAGDSFSFYPGCADDAFRTAAKTLDSLIARAGARSLEVRDWLAAQDVVFSNCGGGANIPQAVQPGASARSRANRAYQIASAYFYAAQYDEAKARFEQIAKDDSSPWHSLAPYIVARVELRREDYEGAETQLQSIIDDPKLARMHSAARSLLEYAEARNNPAKRMVTIAHNLLRRPDPQLEHDLSDYTFLYDKFENPDPNETRYSAQRFQSVIDQDELTRWIHAFQRGSAQNLGDYVRQWRDSKSPAWLMTALTFAQGNVREAPELIAAARQIAEDSPAYVTARFHGTRLLIETKQDAAARSFVDEALANGAGMPLSAVNALRAERMSVAQDFNEFLTYAPRTVVGESIDFMPGESEATQKAETKPLSYFDADATRVFNDSLPLEMWLRAARTAHIDNRLRAGVAQAAWVRAVLIDSVSAPALARELARLKPAYATEIRQYLSANGDRRRFDAVFWMLHHPEARPELRAGLSRLSPDDKIDQFRDNWWCGTTKPGDQPFRQALSGEPSVFSPVLRRIYPSGSPAAAFVDGEQSAASEAERKKLNAVGAAPSFLAAAVVRWANAHPTDKRLPEALALAVKSSRFGCTDSTSARPVREAFELLHRRYPGNEWTRRTPYWYK
jgi:hypothetical protein